MRADSELSPWPRMQEETTRDITRQHILIQERWEADWGAGVDGGATAVCGTQVHLPPAPRRAASEPGLRQRLWGDMPAPSLDALLVEACNRLATQSGGRAVLAFEAIDAADEATVEIMAHVVQRPGWLRLPLLCTMRGILQGRVAELVYLLHRDEGEAAVMAIEDEATPAQ